MGIFESLENLEISEECFNDIMNMVEKLLSEDLEATAERKYGYGSPQAKKASKVGSDAWEYAQNYFKNKGADHDLSTNNDKGQEARDEQMEKHGRLETYIKNTYDRLHNPEADKIKADKAYDRHIGNELRKKGIKIS